MRSREEQIIYLGSRLFVGNRNLTDANCEAQRHIDEAIQRGRELERAEMGRDTARLDWIGNQDVVIGEMGDNPPSWKYVFLARYQITIPLDLDHIRHSIDNAMNAENGNG
ncbi:hypothetical protein [Gluconacetobacter entanii]|uniref:hypothetical protein n=1 Tax=Gluconacetobacter entanii TaxID=108528 RepID=UPI002235BB64|nr:hypothetical protein [Gluconacetobacter entanii]MCW4579186.1 hypothetical protein [Gluconacetobacter entanii]MCW4582576.1 hypothetical protein [Gluconacetobacter entanii]MCW4585975.1 hypothetical protein [Gluconacetobacter entanii]